MFSGNQLESISFSLTCSSQDIRILVHDNSYNGWCIYIYFYSNKNHQLMSLRSSFCLLHSARTIESTKLFMVTKKKKLPIYASEGQKYIKYCYQ